MIKIMIQKYNIQYKYLVNNLHNQIENIFKLPKTNINHKKEFQSSKYFSFKFHKRNDKPNNCQLSWMGLFLLLVTEFLWTIFTELQTQKVYFSQLSVEGMNLNYLYIGLIGYAFYLIYSSYGYFYDKAQIETGKVFINDLVFAYNAFIITLFTLIQTFIYKKGDNKISITTIVFLGLLCLFVVIYSIIIYGFKVFNPSKYYTLISFLGYFIILLSFFKYWPQMIWNFTRKSTKGWSVFNILFDLTGGIFCFIQIQIVHYNHGNSGNVNIAKLILSIMCIVYNLVFVIQHYFIYPRSITIQSKDENKGQTQRILDNVQIIVFDKSPIQSTK